MLCYEHGGDVFDKDVRLDFSVNLNPLGMPDAVKKAVASHMDEYQSYPDIYCRKLCNAIAASEGVLPADVLCGNGAADLIYRICFAKKPKVTLVLAPTFSEYEKAARYVHSEVHYHCLDEKQQFEITENIIADITPDTDLLFLCNPNNPTGKLVDPLLMERIAVRCSEMDTLLVVDECFLAFTNGVSCKTLLNQYHNIVILDAFTKRYAMAGLRLGYLICKDHDLIESVRAAGACWNVSAVAQVAGLAALSCSEYLEQARRVLSVERPYLVRALEDIGLMVYQSDANYLLFSCEKELKHSLLQHGIFVRSCADYKGLDERFYRVSIMNRQQNDELITALRGILYG